MTSPQSQLAGEEPAPPSTWLVDQWKQRGLLAPDAAVTFADVEALKADSWFVRRNRKTPKTLDEADAAVLKAGSWFSRRNRKTAKALEAQRQRKPLRDRSNSIVAAIESRLLTPSSTSSRVSCRSRSYQADAPACDIYLNIYDLCPCWNSMAHCAGLGVYHTGLELGGVEYSFDNHPDQEEGLIWHPPYHQDESLQRRLPLRVRVLLGRSYCKLDAGHTLLRSMTSDWPSGSYDLLECNCHHWCATAACVLDVQGVPNWVTRSAAVLRFFSGGDGSEGPQSPPPVRSGTKDTFGRGAGGDNPHECEPLLK